MRERRGWRLVSVCALAFLSGAATGCARRDADGGGRAFELECDIAARATIAATGETTSSTVSRVEGDKGSRSLPGRVELSVTLTSSASRVGSIRGWYSIDGGATWAKATLAGPASELSVSPEGVTHALWWDVLADLGRTHAEASLEIVPYVPCGPGTVGRVDGIAIDTRGPSCEVDVELDSTPREGRVPVSFRLVHPQSLEADVRAQYSLDGGETFEHLTLIRVDCDGDGVIDLGRGLTTSPDGVRHCFVWDTQADVPLDHETRVRVACFIGNEPEGMGISMPFALANDPTPGPGELIFSELMLRSGFPAGRYFELENGSLHTLNLNGLAVRRWASGQSLASSPPRSELVVRDPSGVVALAPGDYAVFAGSRDPRANGCVEPTVVWPADFTLNEDSTYRLAMGDTVIAELSLLDAGAWRFQEGVALGLDPNKAQSAERDVATAWCAESMVIPACDGVSSTEHGSPGRRRGPCEETP